MSYIRRLPSGRWQATIRGADGKKHTHSHRLKSVVTEWARQQEGTPQAQRRDPRAGDIRVSEWRARYAAAHKGLVSAPRNASLWSVHCEPQWGAWKMGAVTRMESQSWVASLTVTPSQRDGRPLSAATIRATVAVMSSMYRAAVRDGVVVGNPFAELALPAAEPQPVFFYEPGEADALYAAMGELGEQWRVMVQLGMRCGLRFEELAGLHAHRLDFLRYRLEVVDVMTRAGLRQWPKSRKSHRVVPVPPDILEGMAGLMRGRSRESLVFTAPGGGPVVYANWRSRIWYPAVTAAGIRVYPPRVLRHTAASWLAQAGVPLYDIQALLGHESFSTTQRYSHLVPGAHSAVLAGWARMEQARQA